jgi:hypothetical protein
MGIVLGVATVLALGIANATAKNSPYEFFSQTAGDANLTIAGSDQEQALETPLSHYGDLEVEWAVKFRETISPDAVSLMAVLTAEDNVAQ